MIVALTGCAGQPHATREPVRTVVSTVVQLAPEASLTLPLPPGYPQARTLQHFVRAQYGARGGSFEAVLSLSPERVEVVLVAPSGPRLASFVWDARAITQESAGALLSGAPAQNILGDIFLCFWPIEAVRTALPDGLEVREGPDGARTITQQGRPIIEISVEGIDARRVHLRNLAFSYQLHIETSP